MKLIISILLVSTLLMTSCSKDYLNRAPYTGVPLNTSIQTEADLLVALTGAYSNLRATDLFGRTLPVKGDLMADNSYVTTANSNRYISMNNYVYTAADAYAAAIWQNGYVVIKNANNVINSSA